MVCEYEDVTNDDNYHSKLKRTNNGEVIKISSYLVGFLQQKL